MSAVTLPLHKMESTVEGEHVFYFLRHGDTRISLNDLLGRDIELRWQGAIHCTHCQRQTNKSFAQGFCYPCFRSLPQADLCIMKPETCHLSRGTCRDASWGEAHCQQFHSVYLAESSGIKVGITHHNNHLTRWVDQGALQGLVLASVPNRLTSGIIECSIKKEFLDRTNWRTMLQKSKPELQLQDAVPKALALIPQNQPWHQVTPLQVQRLQYPILQYPEKIKALNFEKTPVIKGILTGIKGQYLLFGNEVLNIRKFSGYLLELLLPL